MARSAAARAAKLHNQRLMHSGGHAMQFDGQFWAAPEFMDAIGASELDTPASAPIALLGAAAMAAMIPAEWTLTMVETRAVTVKRKTARGGFLARVRARAELKALVAVIDAAHAAGLGPDDEVNQPNPSSGGLGKSDAVLTYRELRGEPPEQVDSDYLDDDYV